MVIVLVFVILVVMLYLFCRLKLCSAQLILLCLSCYFLCLQGLNALCGRYKPSDVNLSVVHFYNLIVKLIKKDFNVND